MLMLKNDSREQEQDYLSVGWMGEARVKPKERLNMIMIWFQNILPW